MEEMPVKGGSQGKPMEEGGESNQAETAHEASRKKKRRAATSEELKRALEEQKRLAQDNYEKFLRAYAELENYKKRVEREKANLLKYGNEALIRDLLPFIDNLQRAVEHASGEKNNSPEALIQGVELTLKDLMRVLEKHGLKPIESVGGIFDPNLHEAMMQVETEDHEPQTIVEEFQKGYLLGDRLLRPARVSVATRPGSPAEGRTEGEGPSPSPEDEA
ncbi:MAG: nucleotide exchange factor GrpE [Deltaproteobacteria bacterium]|nr:nucleotide exchange factor GrpE [Deltaproteobacteria bacterium]MBW2121612.1 nucleotide exchange factor GrpE [Deltaproteobacteria bacterium]